MSENSSSRTAVRKRESRARHTERHHRLTFIAEYTMRKYRHVYEEADSFYRKLVKQYPVKRKLTTAPEFKVWEAEIKKTNSATTELRADTTFEMAPISNSTTTELRAVTTATPVDFSLTDNVQLNIPLMNPSDVQETRDTLIFQDIYPSLVEEINPEIFNQIVSEIEETDPDFFDYYDQDMNNIIQDEINNSLSQADPLEKELLNY